jgi:hypothetical protein
LKLFFYEALKKNSMKNFHRISLVLLTITICLSCGEEEPVINLSCDFEEGRNAVVDIEGSELKCAYGISGYNLFQDSFDADAEDLTFQFNNQDFYVTFSTAELYRDELGVQKSRSNGIFEVGMSYEADARTGNSINLVPATIQITKLDKEGGLISGKITSTTPIRWVEATPVMGSIIFTFTDLKM